MNTLTEHTTMTMGEAINARLIEIGIRQERERQACAVQQAKLDALRQEFAIALREYVELCHNLRLSDEEMKGWDVETSKGTHFSLRWQLPQGQILLDGQCSLDYLNPANTPQLRWYARWDGAGGFQEMFTNDLVEALTLAMTGKR